MLGSLPDMVMCHISEERSPEVLAQVLYVVNALVAPQDIWHPSSLSPPLLSTTGKCYTGLSARLLRNFH